MHLAVATDTAYLPWCATALLSCLRSTADRPVHVYVLHGGDLTSVDVDRLRGMVAEEGGSFEALAVEERRVEHLPTKGPALGGRVSWLRVLLPSMLPDVDRMLYLDSDTMAVTSLTPLWDTDLAGAALAAVPNVVEPAMWPHVERLGLRPQGGYFNAGVLLMDLAVMREERSMDDISRFVVRHGATSWYDQDALNVVFAERWVCLDPRWNAQNSLWHWAALATEVFGEAAVQRALADPGILHFEGPSVVKPWHYLSQHPFTRPYRALLADTPWNDVELQERTWATRAIRLLPTASWLSAYARLQARRPREPAKMAP